jgi:phosphoribosylformylglycinamidine cyclo-ligase
MKYADIEGLEKKDPFKKGIIDLLKPTAKNLLKHRIRILPESLGEPAALLDFLDEDFYLAFKTDGVGTKSLIADIMTAQIKKGQKFKGSIASLYAGLGMDLIASNVNDLICLGAKPIALSDEIAAGNYKVFTDKEKMKGLFAGFKKGCQQASITIPCGESPTLPDIINGSVISITGSSIGLVRPKKEAIFGQKLKPGDTIFGLVSNGIHTNGLSLARKIVEKLPKGYFTPFGRQTLGEALLRPTKIYVKPILEMLDKGTKIHYMSNISGSAFKKIMRAKKDLTYVIEKLPRKPQILKYLQELENIPDNEAYETWNMGLGFVVFAPENQEEKIAKICRKYKVGFYNLGHVAKGPKKVIIKPLKITYIV